MTFLTFVILFCLLVMAGNELQTRTVWEFDYSPRDITWPTASDRRAT